MSGDWPKDFLDITMTALSKKCSDNRTKYLISYIGKIIASILSKKLESKIGEFIDEGIPQTQRN